MPTDESAAMDTTTEKVRFENDLAPGTDGQPGSVETELIADPMASVVFQLDPETVDEDGYVSIWNVAATTMGGRTVLARELASKMLGFLCKQQVTFVVISSTDANYLDQWFERDSSLLYDWSPTSEKVDVVAQHAQVPAKALLRLLKTKKFDPTKSHNPRRADRVQWFTDQWCIG